VRLSLRDQQSTGLTGTVRRATYLGNQMQYDVDSEVGSLFVVDYRVEQAIPVGSDVSIAFSNRGLALVKTA
jgi:iron(III) transport system ATP-binding protein